MSHLNADYYTPERIRWWLRHWEELIALSERGGSHPLSEAADSWEYACVVADIDQAMTALPNDARRAVIAYRSTFDVDEAARVCGIRGTTYRQTLRAAVDNMSCYLSGLRDDGRAPI